MELRRPASTGDHLYELDHLTILQYFVIHDDFAVARGDHRLGVDIALFQCRKQRHPRFYFIFLGAQDQFDHVFSVKVFILP